MDRSEFEALAAQFLEALTDSVEDGNQIAAQQVDILKQIEGRLATAIPTTAYDESYERWWE